MSPSINPQELFSKEEWSQLQGLSELGREEEIFGRVEAHQRAVDQAQVGMLLERQMGGGKGVEASTSRVGGRRQETPEVEVVSVKVGVSAKKPLFDRRITEGMVEEFRSMWMKKSLKGGAEWSAKTNEASGVSAS
jgi:hypothetical protein